MEDITIKQGKFFVFINKYHLHISLLIIFIYLLPIFLLGENVHVVIHDNMDSTIALYKVLAESGLIFAHSDAMIPNIMNGLPRMCFPSEMNILLWLYYFFGPFIAYVINKILISSIAFFGMYVLLKTHFLKDIKNDIIISTVALCFAILPYWTPGQLSIAGLPLTLYSFLNIRAHSSKKKDWVFICLICFYSSFVLSFIFFIFVMGILWLYDIIKMIKKTIKEKEKKETIKEIIKRVNYKFFGAILLMTCIFLLIEYRLIYSLFIENDFISHRVDFYSEPYTFTESINLAIYNFIFGQYHAASIQQFFVISAVIFAFLIVFFKKIKLFKKKQKKIFKKLIYFKEIEEKWFIILMMIIVVISFWYGFWQSEFWEAIKNNFYLFKIFQFDRIHYLHPLLWYILFALACYIIWKNLFLRNKKFLNKNFQNIEFGKIIVIIILILQIGFLFLNSIEYKGFIGIGYSSPGRTSVSYKQFYAQEQFQEIKNDIGRPQEDYRVVSIGIHPSVAQYNGFYTLDGYVPNYPLEYKYEFRKIIEKELSKNENLKSYFDNWGSRCYIFVNESGYTIENLELNTDIIKDMGGEYIFSIVKIVNVDDNNLTLVNIYENENSIWKIFLYQII